LLADQQELPRRRVALKIIKLGMETMQVVVQFEAEREALAPPKSKTLSGKRFEACIWAALVEAGFEVETQVRIGMRAGSLKEHMIDFVARRKGKTLLVSTKWQNSTGSVEEKVPWEVLCLNHALRGNELSAGFIVLGGKGWSLRNYFTSPEFRAAMNISPKLNVATFETFMGRLFRDEV